MAATFTIKINKISTATIGQLTGVIRAVDFTVIGTDSGQTFELPQNIVLKEPEQETFIQLANLTEADVVSFVEASYDNMDGLKTHIQIVLNREIEKAGLTDTPLPWNPVVE